MRSARRAAMMLVVPLFLLAASSFGAELSRGAVHRGPASPSLFAPSCDSLLDRLMHFLPDSVRRSEIMVFPFFDTTSAEKTAFGTWIAEYYLAALKDNGRFFVAERAKYRKTLTDMDLTIKDVVDDSVAVEVARRIPVTYLLTGTLTPQEGGCVVDARIISSRTGIIMTGATVAASADEFRTMETRMLAGKSKGAIGPAATRSLVVPGWGQFYRGRPLMGTIALTSAVAAVGATIYTASEFSKASKALDDLNNYLEASPELLRDLKTWGLPQTQAVIDSIGKARRPPVETDYRLKQNHLIVAGVVTAAVWSLNVLEAVIWGARMQDQYRLYFAACPPRGAYAMRLTCDF